MKLLVFVISIYIFLPIQNWMVTLIISIGLNICYWYIFIDLIQQNHVFIKTFSYCYYILITCYYCNIRTLTILLQLHIFISIQQNQKVLETLFYLYSIIVTITILESNMKHSLIKLTYIVILTKRIVILQ